MKLFRFNMIFINSKDGECTVSTNQLKPNYCEKDALALLFYYFFVVACPVFHGDS
jgi:hypothetical protein